MNCEREWDRHWKKIDKSTFGKFVELHRKVIISRSVKYYTNKYFPDKGMFIECGSGTSQTSMKINKKGRKLIALDISTDALREAKKIEKMDYFIKADIFHLPIKNNCIDGIWNLGVMEHFNKSEINKILDEFYRVMKKGSHIILFWPPEHGSSQLVLKPIERFYNLFNKKKFHFFPDEISRPKSRGHMRNLIKSTFKIVGIYFDYKDLFTHYVIVCKK